MANLTGHTRYPRIKPTLTSKRAKTNICHLFSSIADDIMAEAKRLAHAQRKRQSSKSNSDYSFKLLGK